MRSPYACDALGTPSTAHHKRPPEDLRTFDIKGMAKRNVPPPPNHAHLTCQTHSEHEVASACCEAFYIPTS